MSRTCSVSIVSNSSAREHSPSLRNPWPERNLTMFKRIAIAMVVLLAMAAGVWLIDTNHRVQLAGWMRGERFHEGMPTNYWLDAMESQEGNLRHTAIRALAHEKAAISALT